MICQKCGASLTDDNLFCPYCGTEIGTSTNKNVTSHNAFTVPTDLLNSEESCRISFADSTSHADDREKTPAAYCASGYFSRAGTLGEEPAGGAPVQPPHRVNDPQGRKHIDADPDMRCPYCGAAVGAENTFCSACGHRLKAGGVGSSKKKKRILTSIAASAACIALIVGVVLLGNTKRSESEYTGSDPYSGSAEAEPNDADNVSEQASFLCGSWYTYSGGKANLNAGVIIGVDAMELHLERTMEAQLIYYVTSSDVYVSYAGTWSPTVLTENTAKITLQLTGGYAELGEQYEEPQNPYNTTITVQVNQSCMTVTETDDAQSPLTGRTFERDLLLQDWIDRELSSAVRQITPEEVHSIYEAFFCENFLATDLVCLADVTHDGLDEMIVVHFCDDQNIEIDGYVYTIDENMQVNLIYSRVGSTFHVRGFFNWYIRETATGFILGSEEGHWSTGYGELSFHEYYLAQDGTVRDISSVSVASSDYATEEEIAAAFDHYTELKSGMKANLYTIYACPQNGYDADTIAMYPMDPTDIFSIETPDEAEIIGHWTYHHELYGAVGIFAFEPDGTGYISIFDNVQYEYTYYVIDDTAFLTIDGDMSICTFERNGDEMNWQMGGQTYYLTYRE